MHYSPSAFGPFSLFDPPLLIRHLRKASEPAGRSTVRRRETRPVVASSSHRTDVRQRRCFCETPHSPLELEKGSAVWTLGNIRLLLARGELEVGGRTSIFGRAQSSLRMTEPDQACRILKEPSPSPKIVLDHPKLWHQPSLAYSGPVNSIGRRPNASDPRRPTPRQSGNGQALPQRRPSRPRLASEKPRSDPAPWVGPQGGAGHAVEGSPSAAARLGHPTQKTEASRRRMILMPPAPLPRLVPPSPPTFGRRLIMHLLCVYSRHWRNLDSTSSGPSR